MKRLALIFFAMANMFLNAATKKNEPKSNYFVSGFIENKGQIHDQNFKSRPDVKYTLSTPGFNLQLKNNSFSYDIYTLEKTGYGETAKVKAINFQRLDVEFVNANTNPMIITEEPKEAYCNYYLSDIDQKECSKVRIYSKIIYKEIYPNIDLEFVFQEGNVKYNFILHKGGKLNQIQWQYKGSDKTTLKNKNIEVKLQSGSFIETIPDSYLKHGADKLNAVNIEFAKNSQNVFGFKCDKTIILDPMQDLIIDPTPSIVWSTYKGGASDEVLGSVYTDAIGNVYTCGWTTSTGAIATSGAHQVSYGGGSYDAIIMKYNNSGVLQWATYYGGNGDDVAADIAIDKFYNLFVCGPTTSTTSIATSSVHQPNYGGGTSDGFLVKFDTNGVRQWGTYYGGNAYDDFYGCTIDKNGNVYVSGSTTSTNSISTVGAHQVTFAGGSNDAYLVKFNNNGVRQWATYYGDNGDDQSPTCVNDPMGNIYLAGFSSSTVSIATVGSHQTSHGGGTYDGFLVKFNANGVRQWGTYYGGNAFDVPQYVHYDTLDIGRGLYLIGNSASTNSIASLGAYQSINNGSDDAFVVRFDTSGTRLWGTYFGGIGNEGGYSATTDNTNIYLVGLTQSSSSIATAGVLQTTFGSGMGDGYIAKFSKLGVLQWSTYFGNTGYDNCLGTAMDKFGNLFVVGTTSSLGMTTVGANQTVYGGGPHDGFSTKFNQLSPLAVEQFGLNNNNILNIYPNPNRGIFKIVTNEDCILEIINGLGQIIMTLKFDNLNDHEHSVSDIPEGIYTISCKKTNLIIHNKIVVIK